MYDFKKTYKMSNSLLLYAAVKIALLLFLVTVPILLFASKYWVGFFVVLLVIIGAPVFIRFFIDFQFTSFFLDQGSLTINWGMFIKKSKSIAFDKIQDIKTISGPLMGLFKLARISIWTASLSQVGDKNELHPDGLLYLGKEDANLLRELMMKK
ncbi:MAG: PH domain-containing protein [Patescibacteria group bacterium]